MSSDLINQQKDFENKYNQEKLKVETITKECSKLEEKYNSLREDIEQVTDNFDKEKIRS